MEKKERMIGFAFILGIVMIALTVGIVIGAAIRPKAKPGDRMKITESRSGYEVILDTQTGVSYLVVGDRIIELEGEHE